MYIILLFLSSLSLLFSTSTCFRISVIDAGRKKRLTAKGEEPVIGLEEAQLPLHSLTQLVMI